MFTFMYVNVHGLLFRVVRTMMQQKASQRRGPFGRQRPVAVNTHMHARTCIYIYIQKRNMWQHAYKHTCVYVYIGRHSYIHTDL